MSFLSNHNTTLASIAEVVEENKRKLVHIEQFLASINEKISTFIFPSSLGSQNKQRPQTKDPVATSSRMLAFYSMQEANDTRMQEPSTSDFSEPNNKCTIGQSGQDTKPPRRDSTSDVSKILDISSEGVPSDTFVPVIFASDDKSKRNCTAKVSLLDLLNGNIVNSEDDVSTFRGCWLGDRLAPHSRVWFYGDPRVIQRAEASGSNPAKLSLNLLEALFTREEMADSNVNGARGRDLLDPIKIQAIYAHINFKFPTDPDKQELRWHLLKPRIDSKCRAQRRIQREWRIIDDSQSGNSVIKEKPFRSKLSKPLLDPKIKDALLYGSAKTTTDMHSMNYTITMATSGNDDNTSESSQSLDPSESLTVVIPQ